MFKPLHSLVTVVLDPKDNLTKGGLVLPDNYGGVYLTGVVRALGPAARGFGSDDPLNQPFFIHPGQRVFIAQQTERTQHGTRIKPYPVIEDDGVKCILCDQSDILGVIED